MAKDIELQLSRRERQIMDILYRLGEGSAHQVRDALPEAPSYSAVRAMLSKLEQKGHISHREQGAKYVFYATSAIQDARDSAMKKLIRTFFDGSAKQAVAALLGMPESDITEAELQDLLTKVELAKKEDLSQM